MAGETISSLQISPASISDITLVRVAYEDGSLGAEPQLCMSMMVGDEPKNLVLNNLDAHRLVNLAITALASLGSPQAVELERIIHRQVRKQLQAAIGQQPG